MCKIITKYAALAWHKKRMEKDPAALTSITLEKSPLFYRKIITITSFLDIYVADDGATENSFIFV